MFNFLEAHKFFVKAVIMISCCGLQKARITQSVRIGRNLRYLYYLEEMLKGISK